MPPNIHDPEALIERYGRSAPVQVGNPPQTMTLGQALDFEQLLCTADTDRRQDPSKRLGYLANILAASGTLRPEDAYLLDKPG